MLSLDQIGVKHSTGKSSMACNYLRFYDLLFSPWRYKQINILEIGVQFGCSLRTWRDYFPASHIMGLDRVDNGVKFEPKEGILMGYGDAYSHEMLNRFEGKFDIIVDDGSHQVQDQEFVAKFYSHLLTDEGVLIIEDVLDPLYIDFLAQALPPNFDSVAVEMTQRAKECRLFLAWRKDLSYA
jgi:hypothetical protein